MEDRHGSDPVQVYLELNPTEHKEINFLANVVGVMLLNAINLDWIVPLIRLQIQSVVTGWRLPRSLLQEWRLYQ